MNVSQRIESVSQPQTILIIDDSPTNLSVMADYLTAHNLIVLAAQTGEDGLEQAQLTQPDLILLDVILPGIDGFETCRRLKADPKIQDIPVILMTVLTDTEHKLKGFRAGVVDYVTKPFEKEEVLARISTQLRLRELTERLEQKVEERTRELTAVNKQLSTEITERKLAEEGQSKALAEVLQATHALRESEEKFRSLAENSQDYIMRYDEECRHLYENPAALRVSGLTEEDIIGKTHQEASFDEESSDLWEEKITSVFKTGQSSQTVFEWEGAEGKVYLDWRLFPEFDESGRVKTVLGISRDITGIKQAEEKIKTSLKEKNVLLLELYHRTKNNMNVISALLSLQAARTQDDAMVRLLQEMDNRIQAMALVHQKLYQGHDLSSLDLSEYIADLAALVFDSYKLAPNHIELVLDLESVPILIDTAIPCGLVLNELFSNALQHAFPGDRKGEIKVQLCRVEENVLVLQFSDNGVGLPPGFDLRQSDSLGMQTVFGIIDHQLQGEATVDTHNGVVWHIRFRDDLYGARV
ncbi:MAG: response regulator [Chloroflexi bacterium]|nr:response regulator [Chloroflexota bacterium]